MTETTTNSSTEDVASKIAVLRQKIHGLSVDDYAETLRNRLPAYEVNVARTPEDERQLLSEVPIATGSRSIPIPGRIRWSCLPVRSREPITSRWMRSTPTT